MSKEVLLELILEKCSNIRELLNGTKDIEDFLKLKSSRKREFSVILKKAKILVEKLYDNSEKLKEEFFSQYNLLHSTDSSIDKKNQCTSSNDILKNGDSLSNKEHLEECNDPSKSLLSDFGAQEHEDNTDTELNNHASNLQEDPLKNLENSDVATSISENNDCQDDKKEDSVCNKEKQDNKSLIRLVDLSKLIDPKHKKTVKFDSSVIILTSSDEDTPKQETDRNKENSVLKPALKNTCQSKSKINKTNKYEKYVDKLSKKRKRKFNSKESRNENEINNRSDLDDTSSESDSELCINKVETLDQTANKSDDSDEETIKPVNNEENFSNDTDAETQTSSENEENSDSAIKQIEEATNEYGRRKSSRIKFKQKAKQVTGERLKKLFNRKSPRVKLNLSERGNEISDPDISTSKNQKKVNNLVELQMSDTSSYSENETDSTSKETITQKYKRNTFRSTKLNCITKHINDEKFKYEVYIPLPRIECSRLKEIYLKNKENLEIKRLTNLDSLKNQKQPHEYQKDEETSSNNRKNPKKSKDSTVADELSLSEQDDSSDDEPLKKPSDNVATISTTDVDQQSKTDQDEFMADIAIKEIDSVNDKEKSESSSVESDTESDNNKKCKKNKLADKEQNEEKIIKEYNNINEKLIEDNDNQEKEPEGKENLNEIENSNENEVNKKDEHENASSDSDGNETKQKKSWKNDKLLTMAINSTDSEEEFKKFSERRDNKEKDELMSTDEEIKSPTAIKRKVKKRVRKAIVSDSDESAKDDKRSTNDEDDSSSDENSNSQNEKEEIKKPARKRIKRARDSSSSDEDKSTRKHIRRVIGKDSLSETTKQAEAEEKERKARIAEKQKKYNQIFEETTESKVDKVVLDYDEKTKEALLTVNKKIVKKLKPHQASGIQFMWDACFESLERANKTKGSGCILAHCMGLGKTLQVIALSHTLLTNVDKTNIHKIMVVCPVNTVLNWKSEFKKWMPKEEEFEVYELVSCKQNYERQYIIQEWHNDGGVLIIGYSMFRNLSNPDNKRLSKKMRNAFCEGLVDPGPDLVVCDEGHLLKNEKTNLSIAMNRIKTARRIVLTGTPLQNNLKEYWCMVQFIKPNLLGTYKEYLNRFVNPITNGQYTDSTQHDILLMRKRSHVLHKLLDGIVQRRDYAVLEPYLPPKYEYILFIRLTDTQVKLYRYYMEKFARQSDGSNKTSFLFSDFQELQRICTHPRVLLDKSKEKREKMYDDEESEGSIKDFIDDGDVSSDAESTSSSSRSESGSDNSNDKNNKSKGKQQRVRVTRAQAAQRRDKNEDSDPELVEIEKEWFQQFCDGEELDNINNSGKLFLLFQILKECEEIGDKVLVFSQSLYTLNCIEYFLEKIDEATQKGETEKVGGHSGSWAIGLDYFRLDGSSSCDNRATWCDMFNNPNNTRSRLFLISTKAGGLGINLVAANRVIIFDVSWNPSHDIQSIYRVYRFGQTKPCYIYRFVTYGTMEMKIYERQVTKQAISKRVIDEQQIDRHYNQNDLQELYRCDLEPEDRPIPMVPKDILLGELLQKYENTIYKYHLHQSLLENKEEEGLNEEERKAAWEEFENEKVLRQNSGFGLNANSRMNAQAIEIALTNIVKKDNPTWSDVQIKGIIPALVRQLQVQLSEGDTVMYSRVQQELQLMQEIHSQKLREAYYQQQVMRMIQRQQEQAKFMGNMYLNPNQLQMIPGSASNMFPGGRNQGGPSSAPQTVSNDVIELND